MALYLQGGPACFTVIMALWVPAIIVAILLHSAWWLVVVPAFLLIVWAALGKRGRRRKISPQQFADELYRHLRGTEGAWDWDDITSIRIADEQMDRLRCKLHKFDNLGLEEWRNEFSDIIAALRRGEIPDVKDD